MAERRRRRDRSSPISALNSGLILELLEQQTEQKPERQERDQTSARGETSALATPGDRLGSLAPEAAAKAALLQANAPALSPAAASEALASRPTAVGEGCDHVELAARGAELAEAIRERGHYTAWLDPLARDQPPATELDPAAHGLSQADLVRLPGLVVGGPVGASSANAGEAIDRLCSLYRGTTGYEFAQIADDEARAWLREAVESGRYAAPTDADSDRALLARLTAVEGFERFLQTSFPGQTRFSLEGNDLLVPMLDEVLADAAGDGMCEVVIGMAHRGRLNVLAHVLGKPYAAILAEFKSPSRDGPEADLPGGVVESPGYAGDVKYHLGGQRAYPEPRVYRLLVRLTPNPSHLELINPVVEGIVRAEQDDRRSAGPPRRYEKAALAILIHGDAAFPGQGIVAETLNLARLAGYSVGGTIHIVVNNQLGFTADPAETRSTRYASDLAKGFEIPIIHVNADDPRAGLGAIRLALAYRQRFRADFLIDLLGYRRWGHNEGDEPAYTQPKMYAQIPSHPTVRDLFARSLVEHGTISPEEPARLQKQVEQSLTDARRSTLAGETVAYPTPPARDGASPAEDSSQLPEDETDSACPGLPSILTAVPSDKLAALNIELTTLPAEITPDPKLARILRRRADALAEGALLDWGHAEALAFASILADGTPIRLTGQDTARGTFSQRHAVIRDHATGRSHSVFQSLSSARGAFDLHNSPLSEGAALGFEYGYSVAAPGTLVVWEAQYGDFANGAQSIIDQFIVAGRAKWSQQPSLVLLVPHGYEGQGPEHSSARLERFLELSAGGNIQVVVPTTAAQYFHVLRRHAGLLSVAPRPLIVLTPKSLLRDPRAGSPGASLAEGSFECVLTDGTSEPPQPGARLVLCSGKIYYDLLRAGHLPAERTDVVVWRVEQLYPFPDQEIARLVSQLRPSEAVWLQEEPRNMGAWAFIAPRLVNALGEVPLRYVGRPEMASPAEGDPARHAATQTRIVREALAPLTDYARRYAAADMPAAELKASLKMRPPK